VQRCACLPIFLANNASRAHPLYRKACIKLAAQRPVVLPLCRRLLWSRFLVHLTDSCRRWQRMISN
jgi:hypothetical protein